MLIHAMQQEGKHLLIQLDEAKQSIRQGTEGNKKKRPSLVHTVRSLVVDGRPACRPLPSLRWCLTVPLPSSRQWFHPRIRVHRDSPRARRC